MKTVSVLRIVIAAFIGISSVLYFNLSHPPTTTIAGAILAATAVTLAVGYKVNLSAFVTLITTVSATAWLKGLDGLPLLDHLYLFLPLLCLIPLGLQRWDDFTLDKKLEERRFVRMVEQERARQQKLHDKAARAVQRKAPKR